MPFGPFESFDDCVAQNGDKGNPQAFCAWLEHEITGQWPGQNAVPNPQPLSDAAIRELDSIGWKQTDGKWVRKLAALRTRSVRGVEIFATGTHNGDQYNLTDLDNLVDSFYRLQGQISVPLRVGHTTDDYNAALAQKMGVPLAALTGDEMGQGQMGLGTVTRLRRKGDILIADLEGVPEPLADLIEGGQYRQCSAEIWWNYHDSEGNNHPYVLCGLALLGAEQPAVRGIAGLAKSTVYAALRMARLIKEDDVSNYKNIAKALGIDEGSNEEAIVQAIGAVMAKAVLIDGQKDYADIKAKLSEAQQAVTATKAELAAVKRASRVAEYTVQCREFRAIPGKPEDMAERLVKIEDADPELAQQTLETYRAMNKTAEAMGITRPVGKTGDTPDPGQPFLAKVAEYQSAQKCDYPTAFSACERQYRELYKAYRLATRESAAASGS